MYVLFFVSLALLTSGINIFYYHTAIIFTLLQHCLLILCGLQGVYAFIGHFFKSDEVAAKIGWPAGNPFQKEIAFTNLAFGTLGIICWWLPGDFWLATIIARSIFLWGAAYIHILDIYRHRNQHTFNAGGPLYADIFYPITFITLYILWKKFG